MKEVAMSDIIQIAFVVLGIGIAILILGVIRAVVLWYFGITKIHDNQADIIHYLKLIAERTKQDNKSDLAVPGLRVNPPEPPTKTIQAQSTKSSPYDLTR